MPKRILQGEVISDKADKTVTVNVTRRVKHPIYMKTIRKSKRYLVHDPENKCKQGDLIKIQESTPISKRKRWIVIYE